MRNEALEVDSSDVVSCPRTTAPLTKRCLAELSDVRCADTTSWASANTTTTTPSAAAAITTGLGPSIRAQADAPRSEPRRCSYELILQPPVLDPTAPPRGACTAWHRLAQIAT